MIDARGAGVINLARGNGHLPAADVIDFARGNGHQPAADAIDYARGNGHQPAADVIDFARGYGTPALRALWIWRGWIEPGALRARRLSARRGGSGVLASQ